MTWQTDLYRDARKGAEKRGLSFDLTRADFDELVRQAQGRCMVTGIPFDHAPYPGSKRRPFTPSLDRIDSSKGYAPANVRLVCLIVNFAMNQWGLEPLKTVAAHLAVDPVLPAPLPPAPEEHYRHIWRDVVYMTVHDYAVQQGIETNGVAETRKASQILAYCTKHKIRCLTVKDGHYQTSWATAFPVEVLALF